MAHIQVTAEFTSALTKVTKKEYLLEYINKGIKVRTSHIDDFNQVKSFFKSHTVEHYDYGHDTLKTVKYVIRGLPAITPSEDIRRELIANHNVPTIQIRQLTKSVYNDTTGQRESLALPLVGGNHREETRSHLCP